MQIIFFVINIFHGFFKIPEVAHFSTLSKQTIINIVEPSGNNSEKYFIVLKISTLKKSQLHYRKTNNKILHAL